MIFTKITILANIAPRAPLGSKVYVKPMGNNGFEMILQDNNIFWIFGDNQKILIFDAEIIILCEIWSFPPQAANHCSAQGIY